MNRMDLDKAWAPLEPIVWPGGGEQPVKRITWRIERLLPALTSGEEEKVDAVLPRIMTAILPGRSWDEIQDAFDGATMRDLITYASRAYQDAMEELGRQAGNSPAGTAPASPPPTPSSPSSDALPESMAVPCGAS
jgi:hypothetical protein